VASGIQIQAPSASDLAHVQDWLGAHRGQSIELGGSRSLELGAPITGARAVLVAVTLQSTDWPAPDLGGVVRVLAGPRGDEPALLVFKGRSPAHMPDDEARSLAAKMLEAIAGMAAGHELMAEVA
jgi:hypothetical protein